jgi:superfamily II DNA or RNA helicase
MHQYNHVESLEEEGFDIENNLYDYQIHDIDLIFKRIHESPDNYNLLYQLPTGGGKTVIFSEIAKKYIKEKKRKVLILTHRIELSKQTSNMLKRFKVKNKIINSEVKEIFDENKFECFVAMVETLNNRIQESKFKVNNVGLVIVDEAHYNSFRKLFSVFENCFILGVTATPLSSNIKLPMHEIYDDLILGSPISKLVEEGFLAKANTFTYDVGLGTLKVGINGDYTVKSSDELYSDQSMQSKLLYAYEERAKGKKSLIFNNGIETSKCVYHTFRAAGYEIKHLDNTHSKKQREEILRWFRSKKDAILTSVSILTTGFDEPSIETIILNRATKSPALYYQMIGRGSRIYKNKATFDILDLGNNSLRFGLWEVELDWKLIFRAPEIYLESLRSDEEIEFNFTYVMPLELKSRFSNSEIGEFNIHAQMDEIVKKGLKKSIVIDRSIAQHTQLCIDNSDDFMEALVLVKLLRDEIAHRITKYCYFISNSTRNYRYWLEEEYIRRLKVEISRAM